jgi:hypothetical protein
LISRKARQAVNKPVGSLSLFLHRAVGATARFAILVGSNMQHRMRLADIGAPEKGQPFGTKARAALGEKVFQDAVRVEVIDVDRYHREVGRIYLGERFINMEMVQDGFPWRYVPLWQAPETHPYFGTRCLSDFHTFWRNRGSSCLSEQIALQSAAEFERSMGAVSNQAASTIFGTKPFAQHVTGFLDRD